MNTQNRNRVIDNIVQLASEYVVLIETAHSQKAVAKQLNVSTSRVRQRIDAGSLYAVRSDHGRVCPTWQFHEGRVLPGLDKVLSVIDKSLNPLSIQRFFITISPDLESATLGAALSPRDWLLTGHSVNDVILLAESL